MMVSEKKCDNFMWSNIFENGYAKPIFCNTFFEKCAKNFIFGNGCYYLLYYYVESIYSHNLIAFQCDKIFNFQGKIHKTFRILDLKIPYFSFVKDNSLQKMLIWKCLCIFKKSMNYRWQLIRAKMSLRCDILAKIAILMLLYRFSM